MNRKEPPPRKVSEFSLGKEECKAPNDEPETPTAMSGLKAPTTVKEVVTGNVKVFCRFRPLNKRELSTAENELCV